MKPNNNDTGVTTVTNKPLDPNEKKKAILKEVKNTFLVIFAAVLTAVGLWVFVYPTNFAPCGMEGVAAMLYKLTGINAGWFSLAINIPMFIVAWFVLSKRYVIYGVLFMALSSVFQIVMEAVNFYQFDSSATELMAAIFSGIMLGVRSGILYGMGTSSGGADTIACFVNKKYMGINVEKVTSAVCYITIIVSYAVYKELNCILLSLVQLFVLEKSTSAMLKGTRNAVEFKIVTKNPQEIRDMIVNKLGHSATIVKSNGMFSGADSNIVISVVNIRQVSEFLNIIKKYPDTFVYYTDVVGVHGNFRWFKEDALK